MMERVAVLIENRLVPANVWKTDDLLCFQLECIRSGVFVHLAGHSHA